MNIVLRLAVVTFAASLVACGGGGGGTPTPTSTTPVSASASVVTTVAPSSYTGEMAIAFNLINSERSHCGFGLLSQSTQLDTSAMAHARYTVTNNSGATPHTEVAGQPGFTGVSPMDRMAATGYSIGASDELVALGSGTTAVRGLMSAPYHLAGLVGSYRDIGIGMAATTVNGMSSVVINLGYQRWAAPQLLASADVKTYPCDGSSGVKPALFGESPNPIPGRDLQTNPMGAPIYVRVRDGNTLAITSASMLRLDNGSMVPLRAAITSANDPNRMLSANEGYVAPDASLEVNTSYQVTVTGTNNGTAFSRTFSFTTGTN